jgi:serine O-acetyltransferase
VLAKLFALKNQVVFGCDIARSARIEGGLYLPHPNGIVIGQWVKIGKNCIIHQGVTLGARGEDHKLANPVIGDEVVIGTGAKILGGLQIGNYARIGANAVVLESVPEKGIAVGIPARTVSRRQDV